MPATAEPAALRKIETDAVRGEVSEIAAYLQEHLGQRIAAYLSGLKDPKSVGQWAKGRVEPREVASLRLRHGYQATRLIAEAFGDETAKAWLFGSNSRLGGEAPAYVLRHARVPEDVSPVVLAAAAFTESAHGAEPSSGPGEPRQRAAQRVAQLLAAEIQRYEGELLEGEEPEIALEIEEEVFGATEPVAERLRALELAHDEVAERLEEVVEQLKNDLAKRPERAGP